jgi:hypothetical protein
MRSVRYGTQVPWPCRDEEVLLYAIDSVNCAVLVIRDFTTCKTSWLDHAPNMRAIPAWKIWRHLWRTALQGVFVAL